MLTSITSLFGSLTVVEAWEVMVENNAKELTMWSLAQVYSIHWLDDRRGVDWQDILQWEELILPEEERMSCELELYDWSN